MLLILAGVSLSSVFGEKGIFKRTESAGEKYNEAKARETLETVLLADGQYEKNTNPEYNQDKFLDELIKSEIPGADVKGDVAIIGDKYAYELDRSVPKIGRYLGLYKDLVWPEVEVTSGPTPINRGREATFTVKASVAKNVITKIELWLDGKLVDKYIKTYKGAEAKPEITTDFTVNRNGVYTIKAYADLMGSIETTVEGIVPAVTFSPNEDLTWRKQHRAEVILEPTEEKITEMNYAWIKDNGTNDPADNLFMGNCLNNRIVTAGDETMMGTYYLWVMLKTETGKINKCVSGAFNFDNEGPSITSFTAIKSSIDGITLSATAQDTKSGIVKIEFYIDNELKYTQPYTVAIKSEVTVTQNITSISTGSHTCKVVAYDALGKISQQSKTGTTKLYTWNVWNCTNNPTIELEEEPNESGSTSKYDDRNWQGFYLEVKPVVNVLGGVAYAVHARNWCGCNATLNPNFYIGHYIFASGEKAEIQSNRLD